MQEEAGIRREKGKEKVWREGKGRCSGVRIRVRDRRSCRGEGRRWCWVRGGRWRRERGVGVRGGGCEMTFGGVCEGSGMGLMHFLG